MALATLPIDTQTVSSSSERIGSAVERTAARFVRTWGFSTVGMVALRFRLVARAVAPREVLARRGLAALPDVQWLDEAREWFTLLERESQMRDAIEKIVSVAGVVEREELEQALGKRHAFGAAPSAVVRVYVGALAARVSGRARGATLTSEELVVLEAFDRAGGGATLVDLREATRARLAPDALARVLGSSPLFLRSSRGSYRVVGSFPWARYVTLAGSTTIVAPIQ